MESDVENGTVKVTDKIDTDGADELAVSGAAEHAVHEMEGARRKRRWAQQLHEMMVKIACACHSRGHCVRRV